jgi:hypothetical protein
LSIARTPLLLLASNEADQSGPLYNIVTTVFSSSVLADNKRLLHVNTAIVTYIFPTPQNLLPLGDAHHYSRINYGDTTIMLYQTACILCSKCTAYNWAPCFLRTQTSCCTRLLASFARSARRITGPLVPCRHRHHAVLHCLHPVLEVHGV